MARGGDVTCVRIRQAFVCNNNPLYAALHEPENDLITMMFASQSNWSLPKFAWLTFSIV
jgi:hypothetical protein